LYLFSSPSYVDVYFVSKNNNTWVDLMAKRIKFLHIIYRFHSFSSVNVDQVTSSCCLSCICGNSSVLLYISF
jgi:hypothetical protein